MSKMSPGKVSRMEKREAALRPLFLELKEKNKTVRDPVIDEELRKIAPTMFHGKFNERDLVKMEDRLAAVAMKLGVDSSVGRTKPVAPVEEEEKPYVVSAKIRDTIAAMTPKQVEELNAATYSTAQWLTKAMVAGRFDEEPGISRELTCIIWGCVSIDNPGHITCLPQVVDRLTKIWPMIEPIMRNFTPEEPVYQPVYEESRPVTIGSPEWLARVNQNSLLHQSDTPQRNESHTGMKVAGGLLGAMAGLFFGGAFSSRFGGPKE